jgi:small subunit ribosomal protein S6
MRSYELMTIHRPDLAETEVRTSVDQIETILKAQGVEVGETEFWGKRRFAYEIDHMREGFYAVFYLNAEPGALDEVDRTLSLSDAVVRHKFIRTDNRKPVTPA